MASNKLEYNVDDLRKQAEAMGRIADDLEQSHEDLKNNLDRLRGEWVSTASTKFFSTIDSDWETAVRRYVKLLRELQRELNAAAKAYEPLEDDYNGISLP